MTESEALDDEGLSQSDSQSDWQGITQLDDGESVAESDTNTRAADYPTEEEPKQSYENPLGRYIPPHLREVKGDSNSEAIQKLTRHLKGLLNRYESSFLQRSMNLPISNRMSEQNMATIIVNVEEFYRNYRRNGKCLACTQTSTK